MKINKVLALLIIIFAVGTLLRLYPAALSDKPLRFDTYYHVRVAEIMKETGAIPVSDPWPFGGRPHIYPPLYHISLAAASIASGASVLDVSRFFLPIISSITILGVFWFVRNFRNERTALIASFLFAFNPFLISSSYESPQVIGLLLSLFAVYFLMRKRYLYCGLLLGVIYLFNVFIALIIAAPVILLLLFERRLKQAAITAAPLALFIALWYLPRLDALYCLNNWIGPLFIAKGAGMWVMFSTPAFVALALISVTLLDSIGDRYRRFWLLGTTVFMLIFLTHFFTPVLHPWRLDSILMFSFIFVFADAVADMKRKKQFFFCVYVLASLFTLSVMYHSWLFDRPLTQNEYALIDYTATLPPNIVPLATHDLCANIMTLTNRSCLLDINFECIPNPDLWYDYETVLWSGNSEEIRILLEKHSVRALALSGGDAVQRLVTPLDVDKRFAAWLPNTPDASYYEINIRQGALSYYGRLA